MSLRVVWYCSHRNPIRPSWVWFVGVALQRIHPEFSRLGTLVALPFVSFFYRLGVPKLAQGWIPLDFEIVVENKPELSCCEDLLPLNIWVDKEVVSFAYSSTVVPATDTCLLGVLCICKSSIMFLCCEAKYRPLNGLCSLLLGYPHLPQCPTHTPKLCV